MTELRDFNPFDIFDAEAARLDAFFSGLDEEGWAHPTRCAGWSVRDVLGHLAGEELYNRAALDGTVQELMVRLGEAGITGFNEFNEWCVEQRRSVPVEEVLEEWRTENALTRAGMRALGEKGTLDTMVGPYPAGLQAFHYASEYATHADDVHVPVSETEADHRTDWRVEVGRLGLKEANSTAQVEETADDMWVHADGVTVTLPFPAFVDATVGRPHEGLDPRIASALRCLA